MRKLLLQRNPKCQLENNQFFDGHLTLGCTIQNDVQNKKGGGLVGGGGSVAFQSILY